MELSAGPRRGKSCTIFPFTEAPVYLPTTDGPPGAPGSFAPLLPYALILRINQRTGSCAELPDLQVTSVTCPPSQSYQILRRQRLITLGSSGSRQQQLFLLPYLSSLCWSIMSWQIDRSTVVLLNGHSNVSYLHYCAKVILAGAAGFLGNGQCSRNINPFTYNILVYTVTHSHMCVVGFFSLSLSLRIEYFN